MKTDAELRDAIRALSPDLTVRKTDGEYRVSIAPAAIVRDLAHTFPRAMDLNEAWAAYSGDRDDAFHTARVTLRYFREVAADYTARRTA